jgi:hypothetical protein
MEAPVTLADEASTEYVGRWNRLISTTNWEKGRIICQWRAALEEAGAPPAAATDEAWSRQVGNVSPQHVGRLRRVHERFGEGHQRYKGLYWSHFQAALDWPDAEMYLEGAVQNGWSIAQMRTQRWEALGGKPDEEPREEDIVASEWDEHASAEENDGLPSAISDSLGEVRDVESLYDDEPRAEDLDDDDEALDSPRAVGASATAPAAAPLRPFESLPPLPADLNEAFELMKLSILAHKLTGWQEIACDDVLSVLESLRQLVLAPAE